MAVVGDTVALERGKKKKLIKQIRNSQAKHIYQCITLLADIKRSIELLEKLQKSKLIEHPLYQF